MLTGLYNKIYFYSVIYLTNYYLLCIIQEMVRKIIQIILKKYGVFFFYRLFTIQPVRDCWE